MTQPAVRIGTSGYSFADWIGVFYPYYTPRGKMLDFYVQHFPTVEINSTYYRIPHPSVMHNMAKKAPAGFDFMVKVPQSFTHRRTELDADIASYRQSIQPLSDGGLLAGCLAQFPYSFKNTPHNLQYLSFCRDAVAPHALFIEFRHASWSNASVYDLMHNRTIGYVSVDEPDLPGLIGRDLEVTTDTAYVRLHGRNAQEWWGEGGKRYDYLYTKEELDEWRVKIDEIRDKVRQVYVYFNNCYDGQAVKNALDFMKNIDSES